MLALQLARLPPILGAGGSLWAVAVAVHAVRQHALRKSKGAIRTIETDQTTTACTLIGGGVECTAVVLPDSVVWPWLILLRVRTEGAWCATTVVILPDAVTRDEWRRLSIWLRWAAPA